jgi:ribosomal protein S18 acetylase RimI-like enzyme
VPNVDRRLFCSATMAARIERAECGLLAGAAAAAAARAPAVPVIEFPLAGGLAVWTAPEAPFNKVAGLGFAGVPATAELDALERAFVARRAPVRVELATLGDPAMVELLTGRGYRLVGFENVLGRPVDAAVRSAALPGIEVGECGPSDLLDWMDAVAGGFAAPDDQGVPADEEYSREALEQAFGDLAHARGFRRYLARLDGEVAGGASARYVDGVAQLCGAATLPRYRRRGVQSALLAARLAAAAAAGCDVAVVTTQPGSKSQENVQRLGFELLYARAVLVLPPPA